MWKRPRELNRVVTGACSANSSEREKRVYSSDAHQDNEGGGSRGKDVAQSPKFINYSTLFSGDQYASTNSLLSLASISMPNPPIAFLLILVAKFFGPSSSAPDGGPRGCLIGWLTTL